MQLGLLDCAGGSQSLAEIDLVRTCRTAGLPAPEQQARRRDSRGRWRYLDALWRCRRGSLWLEIDGIGHMERERWYDDLLREAEVGARQDEIRIRLPSSAVRHDGVRVAVIIARHLQALA